MAASSVCRLGTGIGATVDPQVAGNSRRLPDDRKGMDCHTARRALSAQLDGEPTGVDDEELDRHVAGCADCATWHDRAARIDRLASRAATEGQQVTLPARRRVRSALSVSLVALAVVQLGVAAASVSGAIGVAEHAAGGAHMNHESIAFNVAFGIILLVVGLNARHATSQLPVLAAFVAVLAASSVVDLAQGAVSWARLATHLPIVLGLVATVLVTRLPAPEPSPSPAGRWTSGRVRAMAAPDDAADDPATPADRRHTQPPPAAHRHVA